MNRQPTADAGGLHERASATPVRTEAQRSAVSGNAPSWTEQKLSLRAQQEWFASIVSTPESEAAPVDVTSAARLVKPSATLSALERIEIYRRGYHARLIECLADDYPVLQHALGEDAFEDLCRAYIARHPSSAPSLNFFGRHMSEFCRTRPLPEPGFAADLAALEWAIVLGIHAPSAPSLGFDDLSQVPSDQWAGARFKISPSLLVLHLAYPANAYLQAYRTGQPTIVPSARATTVAVYRTGRSVWRMELEPTLLALVESLSNDETLEAALGRVQALLADKSEQEAAKIVGECFQHSVSSGLFSALVL